MFRQAVPGDLDQIAAIYDAIHTEEESGRATIGWIRAIYPTRQTAADAIQAGDMYVAEEEGRIVASAKIDQLRQIVDEADIPVLCFGLRTDFLTHLFPGSQRLMELADSITEIKTICSCGAKATVNARLDPQGNVLTQGSQVFLGGNDSYVAMCHRCWRKKIQSQQTS